MPCVVMVPIFLIWLAVMAVILPWIGLYLIIRQTYRLGLQQGWWGAKRNAAS